MFFKNYWQNFSQFKSISCKGLEQKMLQNFFYTCRQAIEIFRKGSEVNINYHDVNFNNFESKYDKLCLHTCIWLDKDIL